MPTINQPVRKGRQAVNIKWRVRRFSKACSAAASASRLHANAEKTELGSAQSRPRSSDLTESRLPAFRGIDTPGEEHRSGSAAAARAGKIGVRYHIVRGTLDSSGVANRNQARSEIRRETSERWAGSRTR